LLGFQDRRPLLHHGIQGLSELIRELSLPLIVGSNRALKLEDRIELRCLRNFCWIQYVLKKPYEAIHLVLVDIIFVISSVLLAIFIFFTPIRMIGIMLIVRVFLIYQGVTVLVWLDEWLNVGLLFPSTALFECWVIGVLFDLLDPHQQRVQEVQLVEAKHDLLVISNDAQ
jgi:hypothetical protein